MNTPGEVFARRIREERLRAGILQSAVADAVTTRLGQPMAASAVSRIESGERAVRLDEAVVMAERIGVPLDHLLRDRDAMDEELAELQRALELEEARAEQARAEADRADAGAEGLRAKIARLEAERESR